MSASRLETLQRRFVRAITFLPDAEFAAGVTGGGRLSPEEAVDVYRRGYPARLTEALGETFEACWRVLGDEDFFAICREYISRYPSPTYNLSDYGASFPAFLDDRADPGVAPYLGDLARFEWAFKEIFHAAAKPPLSAQELASSASPDAVLRLGTVSLLALRHRVYSLWKRDRANDAPLERAEWEGAQCLVLYKSGGSDVYVRELTAPEHAALSALAAGKSVEDALSGAEGLGEAGAAALFAFVAEAGIATGVS